MILLKIFRLEDSEEADAIATLSEGEHVIGRDLLGCNDKRVSRKHALIIIKKDEVELKSVHVNPCFYKSSSGNSISIVLKDKSILMKDNDQFALLVDTFWFRVKIVENNEVTKRDSAITDNNQPLTILTGTNKRNIDLSNSHLPNKKHKTEDVSDVANNPSRNVETMVSEKQTKIETEVPDDKQDEVSNLPHALDENAVVRLEIDDENNAPKLRGEVVDTPEIKMEESIMGQNMEDKPSSISENTNKNTNMDGSLTTEADATEHEPDNTEDEAITVKQERISMNLEDEPSTSTLSTTEQNQDIKNVKKDADMDQNDTNNDPSKDNTNNNDSDDNTNNAPPMKTRRERCWYGPACYRKNPQHHVNFSHPGDDDYDSDPDDDRPNCPFGVSCYRNNLDHRREFKHIAKPAPKPSKTNINVIVHNGCLLCSHCNNQNNVTKPGYESDPDSGIC